MPEIVGILIESHDDDEVVVVFFLSDGSVREALFVQEDITRQLIAELN